MPRMPSLTMHQSWPGTRRRRDSQPSIHLPFDVYFPGMKIAGSGLTSFDFAAKKSSLVAIARPPTLADARSARLINSCPVAIGVLNAFCFLQAGPDRHVERKIADPSRAGDAPRRPS